MVEIIKVYLTVAVTPRGLSRYLLHIVRECAYKLDFKPSRVTRKAMLELMGL